MQQERHEFNWTAWFYAIIITICLIIGISNFDSERIVLGCLCLLPAVVFDVVFIRERILEIRFFFNKRKNDS